MAVTYNDTGNDYLHYLKTFDSISGFTTITKTSTTFDYFPDSCSSNDAIYFGRIDNNDTTNDGASIAKRVYQPYFRNIVFYVGTPFSASAVTFAWEYSKSTGSWASLSVTNGNALTSSGEQVVTFAPPHDWGRSVVDSVTAFWVRCRIVSVTSPTEGGAQSTQKLRVGNNTIVVSNYTSSAPATFATVINAAITGGYQDVLVYDDLNYRNITLYATLIIGDTTSDTYFRASYTNVVLTHQMIILAKKSFVTLNYCNFSVGPSNNNILQESGLRVHPVSTFRGTELTMNFCSYATNNSTWGKFLVADAQDTISLSKSLFYGNFAYVVFAGSVISVSECNFYGGSEILFNTTSQAISKTSFRNSGNNYLFNTNLIGFTATFADISADVLRIGTPAERTTITFVNPSYNNISIWERSESVKNVLVIKYFLNLTIVNNDGNPVNGAIVSVKDLDGNNVDSSPFTTDNDGNIPTLTLTHFSATNISNIGYVYTYATPHTITISKKGYQTKTVKYTMDRRREEVEVLEPAIDVLTPMGERIYKNLKPEDGQNKSLWLEI